MNELKIIQMSCPRSLKLLESRSTEPGLSPARYSAHCTNLPGICFERPISGQLQSHRRDTADAQRREHPRSGSSSPRWVKRRRQLETQRLQPSSCLAQAGLQREFEMKLSPGSGCAAGEPGRGWLGHCSDRSRGARSFAASRAAAGALLPPRRSVPTPVLPTAAGFR